jgi:hypothetical protein
MKIKELLKILREAKQDISVYFDFCSCVPTTVGSWRGIYAEPALGWQASGYSGNVKNHPTVASLILELEKAIDGREYTGWKGGEYSYSEESELHIDNNGDCTNTEISHITNNGWSLTIHTKYKES